MADPGQQKCPKCPPEGAPEWMNTFSDMVTLLLTFFVLMFTTATVDGSELKLIIASFNGMGILQGGNTLEVGKLAELGNSVMTLPSVSQGRGLAKARKKAVSVFQPEIASKKIRVTEDERGLVISLASDVFFDPGSAEVKIDQSRDTLFKLSELLNQIPGGSFRIEGHTDSTPPDAEGEFQTNWELSTARANNVLHYLVDFGVNDRQFQVAGFADTKPLGDESTEEGKTYNRRVDVIVLTDGHL